MVWVDQNGKMREEGGGGGGGGECRVWAEVTGTEFKVFRIPEVYRVN